MNVEELIAKLSTLDGKMDVTYPYEMDEIVVETINILEDEDGEYVCLSS